jgi:hypothetical protein
MAFGRSAFRNDVAAAAAEILHLDVEPLFLELRCNVLGRGSRAGSSGLSALTRRIRKPRDVNLEPVYRNRRDGQQSNEERCKWNEYLS